MLKQRIKIAMRADGGRLTGLGHLMRVAALAEILGDAFECRLYTRNIPDGMGSFLQNSFSRIIEIGDHASLAQEAEYLVLQHLDNKDIAVLDGYDFDLEYQKKLRAKTGNLVFIDDLVKLHFVADLVINHAGGIDRSRYSSEPYTLFALGPSFALIRPVFQRFRHEPALPGSILINFGGADPNNDTLSTLKDYWTQLDEGFTQINVLVGVSFQHRGALEQFCAQHHKINIIRHLDALSLSKLMAACSTAILPASTISYEYMATGGELYVKCTADNQQGIYQALLSDGLAFDLAGFPEKDKSRLPLQLENQQKIFDGNAPARIRKMFHRLSIKGECRLRKAEMSDCEQLFEWANDPESRKQSFNSDPIPWENHVVWLQRKLENPDAYFFVLEYKNEAAGLIRYDLTDQVAVLSYSVDAKFRGNGLGTVLLLLGAEAIEKSTIGLKQIRGFVKKSNNASNWAFLQAGYSQQETTDYHDSYLYSIDIQHV